MSAVARSGKVTASSQRPLDRPSRAPSAHMPPASPAALSRAEARRRYDEAAAENVRLYRRGDPMPGWLESCVTAELAYRAWLGTRR